MVICVVCIPHSVPFDRLSRCAAVRQASTTVQLPTRDGDQEMQAGSRQRCHCSLPLRVWQLPPPPQSPDHLGCPLTAPQATAPSQPMHSRPDAHSVQYTEKDTAWQAAGARSAQVQGREAKAHLEVRQHLRLLLLLGSKVDERERLLLLSGVDLGAARTQVRSAAARH